MNIVLRQEAKAAGLRRYFTGKACKHGHVAERFVVSSSCVVCYAAFSAEFRKRPEQKARAAQNSRRSYEKNREKVLAKCRVRASAGYNKQYYEANKARVIEKVKEWIRANPERRRVYRNNRRAVEGKVSKSQIDEIRTHQKGRCAICACSLKKSGEHIDHIVALARGGKNERSNIQLLCPTCNRRKGASDPVVFMQRMGRLI